jgi:hypothetical protein
MVNTMFVGQIEVNIDSIPTAGEDDDLHDLSSSCCKALSTHMFREATSQVSAYYNNSSERIHLATGAMMIKRRDLIVITGQSGDEVVDVTGGVDAAIYDIVALHNLAFSNSVNQFTPSGMASQIIVHRPSPTRVTHASQQILNRALDWTLINEKQNEDMTVIAASVADGVKRIKKITGRKCGFCGFCGFRNEHYVKCCKKRDYHKVNEDGAQFLEYNMTSVDACSHLAIYIEKNTVINRKYATCPAGIYGQLCESDYKCFFHNYFS